MFLSTTLRKRQVYMIIRIAFIQTLLLLFQIYEYGIDISYISFTNFNGSWVAWWFDFNKPSFEGVKIITAKWTYNDFPGIGNKSFWFLPSILPWKKVLNVTWPSVFFSQNFQHFRITRNESGLVACYVYFVQLKWRDRWRKKNGSNITSQLS